MTFTTPVEIDTELARLYAEIQRQRVYRAQATRTIERCEAVEGTYEASYSWNSQEHLDDAHAARFEAEGNIENLKALASPLEATYAEFGWNRYYLVVNSGGHVHQDMNCSTCFPDTGYSWLTEYSGMLQTDLVELAGEQACTVCFPWAPVDVLKRRGTLEPADRKAARLEREDKAQTRAAAKAAKAIRTPSGEVLRVFSYHTDEREVRNRDGSLQRVIPAQDRYETLETLYAAKRWLTDSQENYGHYRSHRADDVLLVSKSIAAKTGTTAEAEIESARKRAEKRG
jgi:hypothetical protein